MSYPLNTRLHVLRGAYKDSVGRVLHLPVTDRPAGLSADYISLGFDNTTMLVVAGKNRGVKGDDLQILWFAPGQVRTMEPAAPVVEVEPEGPAAEELDQGQAECDASNAAAKAHLHTHFPIGAFVRLRDHEQMCYLSNAGSVGQVTCHVAFQMEVHCAPCREGHQLMRNGKPRKGKWGAHTFRVPMRDVERCEPYTAPAQ